MNQFTLAARERTVLFVFMAIGLLCLGATYFTDDDLHSRFWSNLLHNSTFFIGVAFLALMFLCANVIALSGWHVVFKRLWEAYAQFLVVGLALMAIIVVGLWMGSHHIYHWADAESVANDELLQHKSSFLNRFTYTAFTLIILGVWYFFARKMQSLSLEEDGVEKYDYTLYKKKLKFWASFFLPIGGFSSAAVIWLWIMSVDAHWYSTLFAWYCTISWFVTMLCITVLTIIYLKGKGYLVEVTADHLHDLGKYVFGFSIFWTYLWFSQYMLIWYGNIGEETIYFYQRIEEYPVLFYGNLCVNFILPFFVLLRNDTKRKTGTMAIISIILILGHWLDFFLMIKPGVLHTVHELSHSTEGAHGAHESASQVVSHATEAAGHAGEHVSNFVSGFSMPGLLELGTFLGFAAMFAYFFLKQLEKTPLLPKGDPYIDESLHHHVV